VLLRILQLAEAVLCDKHFGGWLDDAAVCEVMETGLSMCCQIRLSEVLRRAAKRSVIHMTRTVFERLKTMESELDRMQFSGLLSDPMSPGLPPSTNQTVHLSVQTQEAGILQGHLDQDVATQTSTLDEVLDDVVEEEEEHEEDHDYVEKDPLLSDGSIGDPPVMVEMEKPLLELRVNTTHANRTSVGPIKASPIADDGPGAPYGLPCIRELLRVLVALVNPHDAQYTDQVRMVALDVLEVVLEVAGRSFERFLTLRALITEDLCRNIFQLLGTETLQLLAQAIRAIELILLLLPTRTRFQRELYVSMLHRRLAGSAGIPLHKTTSIVVQSKLNLRPEAREMLVDSLLRTVLDESIIAEIWLNYDCEIGADDTLENSVELLCKYVTPEVARQAPGAARKAMEGLIRILKRLGERSFVAVVDSNVLPEALLKQKKQKRLLQEGASKFNENPKDGIKFVQDNGIIPKEDSLDPEQFNLMLAQFLQTTPLLNKQVLGEFLSKKVNLPLLQAFVQLFDFKGKRVDEAMRLLLEGFRLPGEAQQIERIMETFSSVYFATGPPEIATQDATFVLSFSVIMLNTDLHNPQVKRRMALEDYMKNLRNVNDNKNFAPEYLVAIYEAIRDNEIVMPQEQEGKEGFEFSWREMARKARVYGTGRACSTILYDKDIFQVIHAPIMNTFFKMYEMSQDDLALENAYSALLSCAQIAGRHGMSKILDGFIKYVATLTNLTTGGNGVKEHQIVQVDEERIAVTRSAVRFGQNYKGQLATLLLFTIACEHGDQFRRGWSHVWQVLKTFFCCSLLPDELLETEDLLTTAPITIPLKIAEPKQESASKEGWFAYLLPSYSESIWEPTEGELEYSRRTCRCVASCHLDSLLVDNQFTTDDAFKAFMDAIMNAKPLEDEEIVRTATGEVAYDAVQVFSVETLVRVALQNPLRLEFAWPRVSEYLISILVHSRDHHPYVIRRAVVGLVRIALYVDPMSPIASQAIQALGSVLSVPSAILDVIAEEAICGVLRIIKKDPIFALSDPHAEIIMALICSTTTHPAASKYGYEATQHLVDHYGKSDQVYLRTVKLLIAFASSVEPPPSVPPLSSGSSVRSLKLYGNVFSLMCVGKSRPLLSGPSTPWRHSSSSTHMCSSSSYSSTVPPKTVPLCMSPNTLSVDHVLVSRGERHQSPLCPLQPRHPLRSFWHPPARTLITTTHHQRL
jgi:brefeldin A-resistance guanine nucleotide exchange factor 1